MGSFWGLQFNYFWIADEIPTQLFLSPEGIGWFKNKRKYSYKIKREDFARTVTIGPEENTWATYRVIGHDSLRMKRKQCEWCVSGLIISPINVPAAQDTITKW